jgi:protein gp37
MAESTEIAWTDSTFNPWIGCTKVSPGCDNCYAAAQDKFRSWTPEGWGGPRKRTGEDTWDKPPKWNDRPFFECPDCGLRGDARAMGDQPLPPPLPGDAAAFITLESPPSCKHLNARPARRRVFCASLADVFDNEVDPQWRADLFDLIRRTPNLDWLLLTKRIGNVRKMVEAAAETTVGTGALNLWLTQWAIARTPPANVWIGATVVSREEMLRDAPKLKATPASVRFWSVEPMLGDLGEIPRELMPDWVIVGGESGPRARPMHPTWATSLRDQCETAGVPFLFKQWGEWAPRAGTTWSEWIMEDGSRHSGSFDTRQHLESVLPYGSCGIERIGKKAAGRMLNGVTHDGFPEVR